MDYKETLNLPQTEFPMRANLAQREPATLARWEGMGLHRRMAGEPEGAPHLRPARRPPVRERAHPHRARAEQDPQGHDRQVPDDGGVPLRLRPRLGLPRPADRAPGGQDPRGEEGDDPDGGQAPPLPRVRGEVHRHPAGGVQAPRRAGRLGEPVPDDDVRLRGRHPAGVRPVRGERRGVPGDEAGLLVPLVPDGAGRGRGRVRGPHLPLHPRQVPLRGAAGEDPPGACGEEGLLRHLDDHAVDDPGQPRDRAPSRLRLRRARGGRRGVRRRRGARRTGSRPRRGFPPRRPSRRSARGASSGCGAATRSSTATPSSSWPTT